MTLDNIVKLTKQRDITDSRLREVLINVIPYLVTTVKEEAMRFYETEDAVSKKDAWIFLKEHREYDAVEIAKIVNAFGGPNDRITQGLY